jgi:hypothetical protein
VSELSERTGYKAWLNWYLGQGAWKTHGRRNPEVRPNVPKAIPAEWWAAYKQRSKPTPTPVPKPAPERHASVFAGRGLFVTSDDNQPRGELVQRAKALGFQWITEQYGSQHWGETYAACREHGLKAFVWDAYPTKDRVATLGGCDGFIAEAEGAAPEVIEALQAFHARSADVPRAIVTNLNPSRTDPAFDGAMQALGVVCIVECYPPADPGTIVKGMVDEARWRGYQEVFPLVGCYDGVPLSAYSYGSDFSIWASDTMSQADWTHLSH